MAYSNQPSGTAFIKRNVVPNEKAPIMKGFVSVSPELLQSLLSGGVDDRGNYKLEVSLWRNKNNPEAVSGTVQMPYKKKEVSDVPTKPRVVETSENVIF